MRQYIGQFIIVSCNDWAIHHCHYNDVIMRATASQTTSLAIFYSRCRSNKTSKLRVTGLCEGNSPVTVNSPHKGPVTRKMVSFADVLMVNCNGFAPFQHQIFCSDAIIRRLLQGHAFYHTCCIFTIFLDMNELINNVLKVNNLGIQKLFQL